MKRIILITLTLLLFSPFIPQHPSNAQSQPESDAPYIYYYSDLLNAFVIERADGTDSRIFGDGLMPENTDIVLGAGWSPSGEWFAWAAGRHAFVIGADGEQHLHFLDDFFQAELFWSPIEDIALIVGLQDIRAIDDQAREATATMRFMLVDIDTQDIISSYQQEQTIFYVENKQGRISYENNAYPEVYWMADGQHVIVSYYVQNRRAEDPLIAGHQVFDLNGDIREIIYEEMILHNQDSPYLGGSPVGKIAFYDANDSSIIVIEDLISGDAIGQFSVASAIDTVMWSPTGEAALFLGDGEIWLWQAGLDNLQPILMNAHTFVLGKSVWSPNGEYAIVLLEDQSAQLLTLETVSVDPLPVTEWAYVWQWTEDNHILINGRDEEDVIYDIDLSTRHTVQTFSRINPSPYQEIGQWSPDHKYFAYTENSLNILNIEDDTVLTFRPDGRSWFSAPGGEVYWHPDGEWLIVAEEAIIAGGGAPRWIGIAKSDGSLRRDLASCYDIACFGWLPANIDPEQLSQGQPLSVLPSPSRVLHTDQWSFYLSWSPDGSQILRGRFDLWGGGSTTVLDEENGTVITEMPPLDFSMGVEWNINDDGQYIPQFVEDNFEIIETEEATITQSPDGELFIVDDGRQVYVYLYTVDEILPFSELDVNNLPLADFSPDGTLLAVSRPQSRTRLYDTTTWELITTLNTNGTAVAFSADGQTLAVASSWDIQLWDVEMLLAQTNPPY